MRGFTWRSSFLSGRRLLGVFFPGRNLCLCCRFLRQVSWRQLARRLPEPFQIVKLARALREYVQYEINIIQKHPLGLVVPFNAVGALARFGHVFLHVIGDCLTPRTAEEAVLAS